MQSVVFMVDVGDVTAVHSWRGVSVILNLDLRMLRCDFDAAGQAFGGGNGCIFFCSHLHFKYCDFSIT